MPNWKKVITSGSNAELNSLNVAGAITASSLQIAGGEGDEGTFSWNSTDNTVDLRLNDVTLQLGQELHYHVINQTGTQINNGEVVYVTGVSSDKLSVAPYSSSMDISADLVLGVATENIANTEFGFITRFGMVRDINTDGFGVGTTLYAATGSSGYTDVVPSPPDHTILLGFVVKEDATEGQIELKVDHLRDAEEIKTDLSGSGLSSTNVQAALLELDASKVNVGALSSNIILYSTTGSSPIPGYFRMVTDVEDPDYNTTAVDVSTGAISGSSGQLIASLASDEGLFVGNPGIIGVTTLGNIRKVSGNRDAYFYYELYQSSSLGETLIATSDTTPDITNISYEEFFVSALLNNGIWSANDRVVVKYYGVKSVAGGADPVYEFQFGGGNPVRTLLPVPVSVVPSENADGIQTDTATFNNILSGGDTDVQKALDTLDDHSHTLQEITDEGNITTNRIIVGNITADTNVLYTSGSKVGIGTTSPGEKLEVVGNISASGTIVGSNLSGTNTGDQDLTPYVQNSQTSSMSVATASYVAATNIDGTIDISDQTNLVGGTNLTLSGDTMNLDANISLTSITASSDITTAGSLITTKTGSVTDPALLIGANSGYVAGNNSGIILEELVPGTNFFVPYFVCNGAKIFGFGSIMTMEAGIDMQSNRLYFDGDQTNTYIASNADDPEDLEIHSDQDILVSPDRYLIVSGARAGNNFQGIDVYGHITASGNISASGDITANSFIGDLTGNADTATTATTASYVAVGNIDGTIDISDQTNLAGGTNLTLSGDTLNLDDNINLTSITASGDVSSSGTLTANTIEVDTDIDITTNNEFLRGKLTGGGTQNLIGINNSNITVVGNISSDIQLDNDTSINGDLEVDGDFTFSNPTDVIDGVNIKVNKSAGSAGDGNGIIIKEGSTVTTAGKIYYYTNLGEWALTDADAESSSTGLLGVALGTNSGDKGMLLQGCVTLATDPGSTGDVLYLQTDTAGNTGDATSSSPSGSNDIVRIIGYCLDNGKIYFNPSNDFIKHA